jgi:hypothetical protein
MFFFSLFKGICFEVIPLNGEKTAAAVAIKQPAKRPSSKKNNKKILSTGVC